MFPCKLSSIDFSKTIFMLYENPFIRFLAALPADRVILQEGENQLTVGQLITESQFLALSLQKSGLKAGQKVVLLAKPGIDFIRIIYANMMVGSVIAIIDPEMGAENYRAKFNQFNPDFAFVDSRLLLLREHPVLAFILRKFGFYLPSLPSFSGVKIFSVGKWLPILSKHSKISLPSNIILPAKIEWLSADDQAPFLITYTSGTLNEPKGVVHTCQSVFESLNLLSEVLKHGGNRSIATHLPHFMLIGIQAGLMVHIWHPESAPASKLDFIQQNDITTLFGPPSDYLPILRHLQAQKQVFPPCLKTLFLGSAPVYCSFLEQLVPLCPQAQVLSLYGMTEHLVTCLQDAKQKLQWHGRGDLVGKPMPGVKITIAPDGEVSVHSSQLFLAYWGIGKAEIPHKTGDLGYLDPNGNLVLTGRKKDMLIRGNFNLYPGLYEPTINKIPGITEAIILGIYDQQKETERVVLVVEGAEHLTAKSIHENLISGPYSIDSQALPDQILFLPLTRSGRQSKVDRKQMRVQIAELV
jgi:acyl-CoA synthetase (AMP-forming)/AMP-acid ligase II